MTDCANATMRDLLPDHVAGMLDAGADAEVGAHVAGCVDCHAEVALLRVARAVRPAAVPVDVARIVAAVNASNRGHTVDADIRHDIRDIASARSSLPPSLASVARPAVRKTRGAMVWRMAASVALVAVGGWSVMSMQDRDVTGVLGVATVSASPRADTGLGGADSASRESATVAIADPATAAVTPAGASRASASASAISVGDLGDFSDDELQTMLDRLERWDGATSADPVTALPVLTTEQRGETR